MKLASAMVTMRATGFFSAVVLLGACSAGTGSPNVGSIDEHDEVSTGRDTPPATGQPAGGGGAGATPTPATPTPATPKSTCAKCGKYSCATGGESTTYNLESSSGGTCLDSKAKVGLTCDGKVTSNDASVGTWTASGSTITVTVGTAGTLTCTPQ